MTTYTRPLVNGTPTTGQVVKAGHVNEPIDQIYDTILAGGITSDQIAAGAVDTSELATAAVTAVKMDGTLPDASAMATSAAPTLDAQLSNKKYADDLGVKGWVKFDGSDGSIDASFNVSGVVRNSQGNYTVSWDTNFSSADYAYSVTAGVDGDGQRNHKRVTQAAGTLRFETQDDTSVAQDTVFVSVIAFGTQ